LPPPVVLLLADDPDNLTVGGGERDGFRLHHLLHHRLRNCTKISKALTRQVDVDWLKKNGGHALNNKKHPDKKINKSRKP
jgi:hypothetical protein